MKIKIIQIGKSKETSFNEIGRELVKRISAFADLEIVTIAEVKASSTFTVQKAIEKEGAEILKAVEKEKYLIVLDEHGREFESKEFSSFLQKHEDGGEHLCFVIGGPFGLSNAVKERASVVVSMSKMTFTHQMIRIFLLEQIYRGFCIMRGKEYHHE